MRASTNTTPHTATFRCSDGVRHVSFNGVEFSTPDLVGYRHLARILARPGADIAALDLVAAERGARPDDPEPQWGLPALDDQAKAAYRRRLAEVDDDIAEAAANNDPIRAELAQRDRDFLVAELSRAVGLGGRIREDGSDAERARTAVFRSIRYAINRLAQHDPRLSEHLRRSVSTGTWCRYDPDPLAHVTWMT